MHWADIYALIAKQGFTLTQVAEAESVTPSLVTSVIRGRKHSFSVASYISALVDEPLNKLWPGEYDYTPREKNRDGNDKAAA